MESVNELTCTRTQCTTAGIDLGSANERTQTRKLHNSNNAKHLLNASDPLHCKQLALPTPQALQGGLAALQCLPMALRLGLHAALSPVLIQQPRSSFPPRAPTATGMQQTMGWASTNAGGQGSTARVQAGDKRQGPREAQSMWREAQGKEDPARRRKHVAGAPLIATLGCMCSPCTRL